MSKLQQFIEAYEKYKAEEAERQTRRHEIATEETRKRFLKVFRIEPDEVSGHTVTIEGRDLQRTENSWQLWGTCPECSQGCWSEIFNSYLALGQMLVEFQPHYSHPCLNVEI